MGCHKKAPVGVMCRWSSTFVHVVYKEFLCGNVLSKLPAMFFQCMNSSTCEQFFFKFSVCDIYGESEKNLAWIIIQLNCSKVKPLVQIKVGRVGNRSPDFVFI